MRNALRRFVERWMPWGAVAWRALRDHAMLGLARPRRLEEGGLLVGADNVADPAFEVEERRLVARELDTIDVFIDVGANAGLYTVLARSRGVQVVAIEPHPVNLRYLHRSIAANGWNDVEVCAVGVGRGVAKASLYGSNTGASLVEGWGGASRVHSRTIDVTTLDALLLHRFEGSRLFLKIDVEGGEYDALCGATSVLRRTPRPRWLVEIALGTPHFTATFDIFFDAGYRAFTADAEEREITRGDVAAERRRPAGWPGDVLVAPRNAGETPASQPSGRRRSDASRNVLFR